MVCQYVFCDYGLRAMGNVSRELCCKEGNLDGLVVSTVLSLITGWKDGRGGVQSC